MLVDYNNKSLIVRTCVWQDRKFEYFMLNGQRKRFHSYLAEEYILNRRLIPGELVHHKDGDPLNNNLSNLQIMTRAEHIRIHKPIKGYRFTDEQRKHLSEAHKGFRHSMATRRKMSKSQKGRVITWGNKITKAKLGKYKISKKEVLEFIRSDPDISRNNLRIKCNLKSYTPFLKWGGLKSLKKEAHNALLLPQRS